jgi:cysteine desulfurase
MPNKSIYLDCNATTPLEPKVLEEMHRFLSEEFGNEASRTHEYGNSAKQAVQRAREQVAKVVNCSREEVTFTSGATESANIALLGLAEFGEKVGRRHIISTQIEHKAALEPLDELKRRGFQITLVAPGKDGRVQPETIGNHLKSDTLLVSIMHANNETGIIQPIDEIASILGKSDAYFHVDAAQTFGKLLPTLTSSRIDLISVSGHKIYGPKGIGALINRRRGYDRPPLKPLMFGGGQERGLRPGTLPVPQIVGLGVAADLAARNHNQRDISNKEFRDTALFALSPLSPILNGDQDYALGNCISLSFPGIDSESLIVALKGLVSLSNGSACTSANYKSSHVLEAMSLSPDIIAGTVRLSWCHMTPAVDWDMFRKRVEGVRSIRSTTP